MTNIKFYFLIAIIAISFVFTTNVKAQETGNEENSSFSVTGDIVSRFIWRGMISSPTLNIQPAVGYTYKNFTVGTWGSGDILGNAKEIDFYMSYSIKGFSASLTDLFWTNGKKYFDFNSETTGHNVELGLSYENEKFPLKIFAGTMILGEDKKIIYDLNQTDPKKQNYSTYFELSYTFNIKQNKLNLFAGSTPFTGMYGNDFAVIYTGFTTSKEIKITDKFSLPVFATFSVNPQTENFYVIFGINL